MKSFSKRIAACAIAAVFGLSCTAYPAKATESSLLQTDEADMSATKITYDQNKIPVTSVDEPSGLTAVYGQKLSDIQLTDGWEWAFPSTILQVNNNGYEAYLTVTDDDIYDYSTVPGYDEATHRITRILSVTVAKADCTITITTENMDKVYDGTPVNNPSTYQIGGSNARRLAWYQKDASGEWTALTSAPVNAGYYKVTAVVEGDANFNGAYTEKEFTIFKATPEYTTPDKLIIKQGDPLLSLTLPEGFSWKDASILANEVGTHTFTALFTPADTNNYNIVDVDISVEVIPGTAVNTPAVDTPETPAADKTAPAVSINAPASASVKTGDTTNIFVWASIFALSGIGILCTIILRHRTYR